MGSVAEAAECRKDLAGMEEKKSAMPQNNASEINIKKKVEWVI